MNIFVLDLNTEICARFHNDRHIVKMILESAEMLCLAHNVNGGSAPYKIKGFKNHPCSVWVRQSINNYRWLCSLGNELCKEYTFRYGRVHKTQAVIEWLIQNEPTLPDTGMTPFAQAMPVEFRNENAVTAYRQYYNGAKQHLAQWKKREQPSWFKREEVQVS